MSKKNKTTQQAPVKDTEVKDNKSAKQTQVNNPQKPKEVKKPEVEKEKRKQTPPPVDPTIETVATEEVKPEPKEEIPSKIDLNNIKLQPHQRMSGDGYARLLEVAQRHIAGMKSGEPATIKMEQAFTYNLAWGMTKASIQAREEKLELGLAVPNDDVIVQDVINTFNNIGVTMLPHHVSDDGKQMTLAFKDIAPETEKEAKEEIKQEKKAPVVPELDASKWKDENDAKNGLSYILSQQNSPFPNRFSEALMKVRLYRQNQESDEAKKETWNKIGLGALFEDAVTLLGNKSTALVRGLCQGTVSSLIADHNPIFAHSTVKYNLPVLSEEEVVDLIKAFIRVRNADSKQPIDDTTAVKNGILEPTRDFFLQVPQLSKLVVNTDDPKSYEVGLAKKIMNKFYEAYKTEVPMADPKFMLNATNKMIEIRNMYVDKDAAFALYTESEYPKETPKSEETADPKKDEKPVEEKK